MTMGHDDDPALLTQRASNLREHARQARGLARTLAGYLDDVVFEAAPRPAAGAGDTAGGPGQPIWTGPYADRCTAALDRRRTSLHSMAQALMADAGRWDGVANELDDQARAAARSGATAGGGR
ncbi:MAG: hypothetical protein HOY69_34480 [Streptomyces sp.]|nr:hypothetical protein [Streptomyces sp.]